MTETSEMATAKTENARAALPSVSKLLETPAVLALIESHGRDFVVDLVRETLDALRFQVQTDPAIAASLLSVEAIVTRIKEARDARLAHSLRRVFNLSGTVLHTNLGRALLPQEAIDAMAAAAASPSNLEFDLEAGQRGDRDAHLETWLMRLTGAEAATVVNNNAAAVLLVLNTLALGKRVAVSRGELVEIGGSFRLPEIMTRAGCELAEVGTTNRTHLKDYENAFDERMALVMRVHASNYEIRGFVKAATGAELAAIAGARGVPYAVDLGSGALVDLQRFGLPYEPTPMAALAEGADIVTFSGDKLLGGPQAGVIVGRKDLIGRIKANPMKRALRLDKMTIAALEAVLRLYAQPEKLVLRLPTLRLLTRPREEIAASAERCLPALRRAVGAVAEASVIECESQIGSGSLPTDLLPSAGLALRPLGDKRKNTAVLAEIGAAFRALPVPVVGRVNNGAFILDLRCLDDEEEFCAQLPAQSPKNAFCNLASIHGDCD